MLNNDYTDITFLLDRSGSMGDIRKDVINGFNTFVEDQKKISGKLTINLIQFDGAYEPNWFNKDINEVPVLTKETYQPRGSTSLLDAIGEAIKDTGKRLKKMEESDRPGKVLIIIYTDGEENTSRKFSRSKIGEMIKHQEEKYSWQFSYMGANQDSFAEAGSMGVNLNSTANWQATAKGTRKAYGVMSASVASYRSASAGSAYCVVQDEDNKNIVDNNK